MRKELKRKKGISLIALIITIIVLLILAGITIGALTSKNGVLNNATKSRKETITGKEIDQIELAYNAAAIGDSENKVYKENLQRELDKIVGENKAIVSGNKTLKVEFLDTKNYYKVNGDTSSVTQSEKIEIDSLQVGDYVDYTYDDASSIFFKAYSSSIVEENVICDTDHTVTQTKNLKWRIFNIDEENETIDLISENPTNSLVYIRSAPGYANGVQAINKVCREHYSNSELNIYARSMKIEDIYNKLNTAGKQYLESVDNIVISNVDNRQYPSFYRFENGSGIDTDTIKTDGINGDEYFTNYDQVSGWWSTASSKLSGKITFCKPVSGREYYDNEIDYNLIYDFTKSYWLGTRSLAKGDNATKTEFCFTISGVGSNLIINGGCLATNLNYYKTLSRYLRPMVTVDFDMLNNSCEKDENNVWILKRVSD